MDNFCAVWGILTWYTPYKCPRFTSRSISCIIVRQSASWFSLNMLNWYLFLAEMPLSTSLAGPRPRNAANPRSFCFVFTSPAGGYASAIKFSFIESAGLKIKRLEGVRSGGRSRKAITHRRIGTIITKRWELSTTYGNLSASKSPSGLIWLIKSTDNSAACFSGVLASFLRLFGCKPTAGIDT